MTEQIHDWWNNLTVIEQGAYRHHERQAKRKAAEVRRLKRLRPFAKMISRMEIEIAGHLQMRYRYQNRGTQRAKLALERGLPKWERKQGRYATPRFTKRDRKVTHMQAVG